MDAWIETYLEDDDGRRMSAVLGDRHGQTADRQRRGSRPLLAMRRVRPDGPPTRALTGQTIEAEPGRTVRAGPYASLIPGDEMTVTWDAPNGERIDGIVGITVHVETGGLMVRLRADGGQSVITVAIPVSGLLR